MNQESDIREPVRLTPESLRELEEEVLRRLFGPLRDFRLSIRDYGLVLGDLPYPAARGNWPGTRSWTSRVRRSRPMKSRCGSPDQCLLTP
jgi:hypothetical protein